MKPTSREHPDETDIELLTTDIKAFFKWIDAEKKAEKQQQIDAARAKVDTEINNARQLESEASRLTHKLKRYF